MENKISSLESKMKNLASDIQNLTQAREDLHRKRSEIMAAIPVIKEAIEFWRVFWDLSKVGTTILDKIVSKANKKRFFGFKIFKIFRSKATQHTTSSFMVDIEKEAGNYAAGHIFAVDYLTCMRCRQRCREIATSQCVSFCWF